MKNEVDRMVQLGILKWEEELENKTSVKIYKDSKTQIKDDGCYDNKFSSTLLFKARSNTLNLNIQKRHKKGDISCDLCGGEKEDLAHFLLDCKELDKVRDKEIIKEFFDENKDKMIGKMLHTNKQIEIVKKMLERMWKHRQKKKEVNEGK